MTKLRNRTVEKLAIVCSEKQIFSPLYKYVLVKFLYTNKKYCQMIAKSKQFASSHGSPSPEALQMSYVPFLALALFVSGNRISRILFSAELAFRGQLAHSFLHGQITRYGRLADIDATIRARSGFVSEASIGQHMSKASSAHEMSIGALKVPHMLQYSRPRQRNV